MNPVVWTASRQLVLTVAVFEVLAHLSLAAVLLRRRGSNDGVWGLICQKAAAGLVLMLGWVWMIFDPVWGPRFYDVTPPAGWLILAAAAWQAVAHFRLSFRVLKP